MTTSKDNEQEAIYKAMKAAGLPVDQWNAEIEAKRDADPTNEWRPFTVTPVPKYGKIKGIRPGFEEFKVHPSSIDKNHLQRRCQAALKRTDGKIQCRGHATIGSHLCRMHGGAKGIGKRTPEGIANQIASVTVHGRETRAIRAERSANNSLLKQIDAAMRDALSKSGIVTTEVRAPKSRTKSKASRKPKNG
jgi:hypothetical protein